MLQVEILPLSSERVMSEKMTPATEPPAPTHQGGSRRRYWGYLARIAFVAVVAVVFSKREVIRSSALQLFASPPVREEDIMPNVNTHMPSADYFNPPFDPENPPDPIYSKSGVRLITKNELAAHGSNGSLRPLWLAILGKVFDVSKGEEHYYGVNGGYNFFTGQFNDSILVKNGSMV